MARIFKIANKFFWFPSFVAYLRNNVNKICVIGAVPVFSYMNSRELYCTGYITKSRKEILITEYENRLRVTYDPEAIFKYFASFKDAETEEYYMTPTDFVQSFTLNWPSQGSGLQKHTLINVNTYEGDDSSLIPDSFKSITLNGNGLINFPLFLLLKGLLSISSRHLKIAFEVVDKNGDKSISYNEFIDFLISFFRQGKYRSQNYTARLLIKDLHKQDIFNKLFNNQEKAVTLEDLVKFIGEFQSDVWRIEFSQFSNADGNISEEDFVTLVFCYSIPSMKKEPDVRSKIKGKYANSENGVSFEDYCSFNRLMTNIEDIEVALKFIQGIHYEIDKDSLKHVAAVVAHVNLSDKFVDLLFDIFDDDGNGKLSTTELVHSLKNRSQRSSNTVDLNQSLFDMITSGVKKIF